MIVFVGASGRLGHVVAEKLLARGQPVRALARTPAKLEDLRQRGAEVVTGDLRDPASLSRACQGATHVVAAAHALVGKGENNPHTVDAAGHRALIDAALAAGVQQLVYLSIQGISPTSPVEFFRIKYQTEEYLRSSSVSFTILRACAFMDLWAQLVGQPILEQGKTTIFGRGNNPINFVAVEDVARYVLLALDDPRARNQTIEVGGPENRTFNEVATLFERASGRPAKKTHVPLPMMRAMASLMRPINPALSRQINMGIYMDTANLRFDMRETLQTFPLPLTTWEEWIKRHTASGAIAQHVG